MHVRHTSKWNMQWSKSFSSKLPLAINFNLFCSNRLKLLHVKCNYIKFNQEDLPGYFSRQTEGIPHIFAKENREIIK
jgi:hypothetical protein